jgi:phosphatidate cytidylyltransferase
MTDHSRHHPPFAMMGQTPTGRPKKSTLPERIRKHRLADLLPRAVSSLVLMSAALASVWLGGTAFLLIWIVGASAVGYEWQHLIGGERQGIRLVLALLSVAVAGTITAQDGILAAVAFLALAGTLAALVAGNGRRLWAFAGIAYAGALIVSVVALHASQGFGARAIVWLYATVWGTDVFAYFGGRLIGGPKLWPKISPSKTWSGTLTGIVAGAVFGAVVGARWLGDPLPLLPIFLLGLVTAMVSQAGDVFESCIKRHYGVKDSSVLIPGHGGFMDRLDGFVAAAAFATSVGLVHGAMSRLPSIAEGLFVWG